MTQNTFTFVSDADHGWLLVSPADLADVGLTEADITPYSYQRDGVIGLEEDCDTGTFLQAFTLKHGDQPEIIDATGTCRGWARFGSCEDWRGVWSRLMPPVAQPQQESLK